MPERYARRVTRAVRIGNAEIGGYAPIVVQSMTATKTQDIEGTVAQVNQLTAAGAGIVRIAVDSAKDAAAIEQISERTGANLSVDLQENYRLAAVVAPNIRKLRYNPGHLHHHEKGKTTKDKVEFIAEAAFNNDCGIRIGVNGGSVDPELANKFGDDTILPMIHSAVQHCRILDDLGFSRYVVSLKDSDPAKVIEANSRFAQIRPDVPLHLGVTEAGLPPAGVNKTRFALGRILSMGIGETLRVSLTVGNELKVMEIEAGRQLIDDVEYGRSMPDLKRGLNVISCPSCSRVENEAFVKLAEKVEQITAFAQEYDITIAVMGCRVNGPGETDEADLGLWCGPSHVNLKRGQQLLGLYNYEEVLPCLNEQVNMLVEERKRTHLDA